MQPTQITAEGLKKLQAEHDELVSVKKLAAIDRLGKARAMGDLAENSEYHAAKEDLAVVHGRIRELEELLKKAVVVEQEVNGHTVTIGSTVKVLANGTEMTFHIVGEFEANPMEQKLSSKSPIGNGLLKKKVGDVVMITLPKGQQEYKVLAIS